MSAIDAAKYPDHSELRQRLQQSPARQKPVIDSSPQQAYVDFRASQKLIE